VPLELPATPGLPLAPPLALPPLGLPEVPLPLAPFVELPALPAMAVELLPAAALSPLVGSFEDPHPQRGHANETMPLRTSVRIASERTLGEFGAPARERWKSSELSEAD
jgi:hypothetical protein